MAETAQDIIAKLFPVLTLDRVQKAQGAAQRAKVQWSQVTLAMSVEQRQAVSDVLSARMAEVQPPIVVKLPVESVSPKQFVDAFTDQPLEVPDESSTV